MAVPFGFSTHPGSSILVIFGRVHATIFHYVGLSVGWSVGPSPSNKNEPNQYNKAFSALEAISNDTASIH